MGRTDSASTVIDAPLERVWDALTDPDQLAEWLPPGAMTGRFEHYDLRAGGSYRLVLTYADDSAGTGKATDGTDVVDVRFVDVVPNERIVQAVEFVSDDPAFAGTMTMTWSVSTADDGRGTTVDIVAEDVPPGITAEDHAEGLRSSLDNLARHLDDER